MLIPFIINVSLLYHVTLCLLISNSTYHYHLISLLPKKAGHFVVRKYRAHDA